MGGSTRGGGGKLAGIWGGRQNFSFDVKTQSCLILNRRHQERRTPEEGRASFLEDKGQRMVRRKEGRTRGGSCSNRELARQTQMVTLKEKTTRKREGERRKETQVLLDGMGKNL